MKKLLKKPTNVLEKRKMVKQKNCIKKTNMFKVITMNFVQEQLKTISFEILDVIKTSFH